MLEIKTELKGEGIVDLDSSGQLLSKYFLTSLTY